MAKQYPNRSDLRNPAKKIAAKAAPGQTYGEAGKQMAAQRAVPMAAPPTDVAPTATPQQPRVAPGSMGPLNRPTERPDEPLTAGAPFGPGRTQQLGGYIGPRNSDPILDELRALYATYPSEELADMLDSYIREGY
jgi:hypothetical protein